MQSGFLDRCFKTFEKRRRKKAKGSRKNTLNHTFFQRKSFKQWFGLSFQRAFQQDLGRGEGAGGERELMKWCVDLVEKTLVVEGVQRRESEWERIVIFKISKVVVGSNNKCKIFSFQDMIGEWIRSKMTKAWLDGT
jgi:hypothetical protein